MNARLATLASALALCLALPPAAKAKALDYFEALDTIVNRDLNLRSQDAVNRSEIESLLADRRAALPTLTGTIARTARNDWHSSTTDLTNNGSYWQLDGVLNLYRFGADRAHYRLAEKGDSRYAATGQRQILEAEKAASEKILAYVFNSLDLQVLEKIRQVRSRLFDVANKQYNKGLLPKPEVTKVDLDLKSIELQIKRAEVLVNQAKAELERYLGVDTVPAVWPLRSGAETLSVLSVSREHPAVAEAREAVAMEEQRETIYWAGQYPTLDAEVIASRGFTGEPFNAGSTDYLLTLTVPIIDRGVSRSLYSAQRQRTAAARYNLDWVKENLDVARKSAALALKESASNVQVYEELTVEANQLYQDSLRRFERGLMTVNDLGLDEARVYSAERDKVQSWYTLHLSWIASCQNAGLRLRDCRTLKPTS